MDCNFTFVFGSIDDEEGKVEVVLRCRRQFFDGDDYVWGGQFYLCV
jgi:hypothetical protein